MELYLASVAGARVQCRARVTEVAGRKMRVILPSSPPPQKNAVSPPTHLPSQSISGWYFLLKNTSCDHFVVFLCHEVWPCWQCREVYVTLYESKFLNGCYITQVHFQVHPVLN